MSYVLFPTKIYRFPNFPSFVFCTLCACDISLLHFICVLTKTLLRRRSQQPFFLTALPMECPIVFFFLLVLLRSPERQNLNRKKTPFVKHLIEPGGTSFIPLVKLSRRFGENQKNITTADKFLLSIYLQRLCTCQSSISRSFKLLEGLCRFDVGQAN